MSLRVLMVTSEWPTPSHPDHVPFIVRRVQALREAGVSVDVEPFRGARRLRNYLRARARIRGRLVTEPYDVVHAQFGQAGLTVLPSPIPMVVTLRGSDVQGIVGKDGKYTVAGRVLSRISRMVAARADELILVSESLSSSIPKGLQYHVVPSGVDLDLFRPGSRAEARRRLGLSQEGTFVRFSGRPDVPVKRFGLAQRAVSLLEGGAELVPLAGQPPEW